MLIDYQSKHKDICTAAQRLRSNGVVVQIFFIRGWAPAEKLNTTTLTHIWVIQINSIHPSSVLPSFYKYII